MIKRLPIRRRWLLVLATGAIVYRTYIAPPADGLERLVFALR
jgi:hypothetical protein